MSAPERPQLCLRADCEHHEDEAWLVPPPAPRPVYAAALRGVA